MERINMNPKDFERKKPFYSKVELVKNYKNGSADYKVICTCGRCSGRGYISWSSVDSARCWKCETTGKVNAIIHVTDTASRELTPEEIEENWKKMYAEHERDNLKMGYKKVDFKIADWFSGWVNDYAYYRIIKETEKAYCIRVIESLKDAPTSYSETWFPKSAVIFAEGKEK